MIKIERIDTKYSSCTACDRGKLGSGGRQLIYPYDHVFKFNIGNDRNSQVIKLCPECMADMRSALVDNHIEEKKRG